MHQCDCRGIAEPVAHVLDVKAAKQLSFQTGPEILPQLRPDRGGDFDGDLKPVLFSLNYRRRTVSGESVEHSMFR